MLNPQIRISFLEREFIVGDRSGKYIAGYEPAIVVKDGKLIEGRIIDPKLLGKSNFIDSIVYSLTIPYSKRKIDLKETLENTAGKKWLDQFESYHLQTYGHAPSRTMSITPLIFPLRLRWEALPENYIDLVDCGKRYDPPKAILETLPQVMLYGKICPPLKLVNGSWMRNAYYKRKAVTPDGKTWEISTEISDDEFRNSEGVLLGMLNGSDLSLPSGTFDGEFPMIHYLDVCYPVRISDTQNNPLTIRTELLIR